MYLLQLRGDVMNMIVQFLTWDVQQLRGDVMDNFVDTEGVVTQLSGHSGWPHPENRKLLTLES